MSRRGLDGVCLDTSGAPEGVLAATIRPQQLPQKRLSFHEGRLSERPPPAQPIPSVPLVDCPDKCSLHGWCVDRVDRRLHLISTLHSFLMIVPPTVREHEMRAPPPDRIRRTPD